MTIRSVARLSVAAAGLAAAALAAPAAQAAPVYAAPGHAAPQVSHGLHGLAAYGANTVQKTGNWSGYAATGAVGSYTSVAASWVQPAVKCTSANAYSSYWVGLDGDTNSSLEQTGTEADCVNGQASYAAWWEVLPASETIWPVSVAPGDHLTATVKRNSTGTFTMTLSDSTKGWTKTKTHAGSSGYKDDSAEVIAENTDVNGSYDSLADFGTVTFSNATADGKVLGTLNPTLVEMTGPSGDIRALPAAVNGGTFSDTWKARV